VPQQLTKSNTKTTKLKYTQLFCCSPEKKDKYKKDLTEFVKYESIALFAMDSPNNSCPSGW
jgi:hypothetical protein